MKIAEFHRFVNEVDPELFESGRYGWAARAWEVKLPNGVMLGFVPEPS